MTNRHRPFFIIAMPRCRTAWIANLLTWGNTVCFHELWIDAADDLGAFKAKIGAQNGNSDSSNCFHIDELIAAYPEAAYVVIESDRDRVFRSIQKACPEPFDESAMNIVYEAFQYAKRTVADTSPLVIDADNWRPVDTLRLWSKCLPGLEFPYARNNQLDFMNVQITPERWEYITQRVKEAA